VWLSWLSFNDRCGGEAEGEAEAEAEVVAEADGELQYDVGDDDDIEAERAAGEDDVQTGSEDDAMAVSNASPRDGLMNALGNVADGNGDDRGGEGGEGVVQAEGGEVEEQVEVDRAAVAASGDDGSACSKAVTSKRRVSGFSMRCLACAVANVSTSPDDSAITSTASTSNSACSS
jgi:hypothetical protein